MVELYDLLFFSFSALFNREKGVEYNNIIIHFKKINEFKNE